MLAKGCVFTKYSCTRNNEARKLQLKHLDFNPPAKRCSNGRLCERIVVNLRFRKNWQRKLDSEELGVEGHVYNVYRHPNKPAIDLFHHLTEWKEYYAKHLLRRPLEDEDYLFPAINFHNLTINPDTPVTRQAVDKLIKEMAAAAGLPKPDAYTTHCFRRGGAQYRFMFAPIGERWTMARIRWWGGWAENETGDTLIHYLLDELHAYEEDHSDALCPIDESANRSHMGEDRLLRPFTAADGQALTKQCSEHISKEFSLLKESISECMVEYLKVGVNTTQQYYMLDGATHRPCHCAHDASCMSAAAIAPHVPYMPYHPPTQSAPTPHYQLGGIAFTSDQHSIAPQQHSVSQTLWPPASTNQQPAYYHNPGFRPPRSTPPVRFQPIIRPPSTSSAPPNPLPMPSGPRCCVPKIPRSAGPNAVKIILKDWETPQPGRCPVPMKDWDKSWYEENNQASAYHIRRVIATEYIDRFKRNEEEFRKAYPDHTRGMTPLFKAIVEARQSRDEAKTRAKKHKFTTGAGCGNADPNS
ncbi:hypothetical protein D9611_003489 [Ephemerocybe angulata]|uniref:Uncharacterized protein n=1 Tax=Ephemerocybe angulata TaxID=980116 RepID=A0A8H5B5N8_9AGAR|nr:hypothetical protein D9611_003487 [Tulosesus angulatus]KAF5316995.1 hypothetical protein D9611_003489 [Tulosesus angulatus]